MLPYAGKKIKPPPEVSQQLSYNDWKQPGFLLQEIYNGIIPVFSNPSSGPPLAWPGTDWDSIPQSCRFAPNGTSCICGSYPWAWLVGRCTLDLNLLMASYYQSFQRRLMCHTLKLIGQDLYFTGVIVQLQYSFPLWELEIRCYAMS